MVPVTVNVEIIRSTVGRMVLAHIPVQIAIIKNVVIKTMPPLTTKWVGVPDSVNNDCNLQESRLI